MVRALEQKRVRIVDSSRHPSTRDDARHVVIASIVDSSSCRAIDRRAIDRA
jgi:hypothetical protein